MKMSKEVDLGKERIGRLFFMLAVPAILSQLVNALYNMVDRMYIGHIPEVGATALTGVGISFPIIMIISAFAALVAMGGSTTCFYSDGAAGYQGGGEDSRKLLLCPDHHRSGAYHSCHRFSYTTALYVWSK